jgi:hypothetical protein
MMTAMMMIDHLDKQKEAGLAEVVSVFSVFLFIERSCEVENASSNCSS